MSHWTRAMLFVDLIHDKKEAMSSAKTVVFSSKSLLHSHRLTSLTSYFTNGHLGQ